MTGSLRAYSRHRAEKGFEGQTLAAVQRAIESGRISKEADGKIDFGKADASWASKTAPSATNRTNRHRAPYAVPTSQQRAPEKIDGYTTARALKEGYLAGLAQLEFKKKNAELTPVADVQRLGAKMVVLAKNKLLAIGNDLAPDLAVETDATVIKALIDDKIFEALSEISNWRPGL